MNKTQVDVVKDMVLLDSLHVPKTKIGKKHGVHRNTVARILKERSKYLGS